MEWQRSNRRHRCLVSIRTFFKHVDWNPISWIGSNRSFPPMNGSMIGRVPGIIGTNATEGHPHERRYSLGWDGGRVGGTDGNRVNPFRWNTADGCGRKRTRQRQCFEPSVRQRSVPRDGWMETRQDGCGGVGIVRLGETSIVRQPKPLKQTYSPWEPG